MTDEWKIQDNSETLKKLDRIVELLERLHTDTQTMLTYQQQEAIAAKVAKPKPPTRDRPVRFANVYGDDDGAILWHDSFIDATKASQFDGKTDEPLVCRFVVYESGRHEVIPRDVTEWPVKGASQ